MNYTRTIFSQLYENIGKKPVLVASTPFFGHFFSFQTDAR